MKKLLMVAGLLFLGSSVVFSQSSHQPPNGYEPVDAYSLFFENYRSDSYEGAIKYGRWIWKSMPETIEGYARFDLEKNMDRLAGIYTGYARTKEDPALRSAYLDTALIIYDKVFNEMGDEIDRYEWHFDRGRFYQSNSDFIDNGMEKAVADYKKAFELNPEKLTDEGNGYYIQIMLQSMVSNGLKEESLAIIEKVQSYAGEDLENFIDDIRNELFDSNEERIAFLKEELKENPDDTEILKQLKDLYEEEEMTAEIQEINRKLYELNPNFKNTRALAQFAIKNANYNEAIQFLNEAIEKTNDQKIKAEISLNLAEAHLNSDNLREARRYARRAAELKRGWGQPYLLIGDIYAEAVNSCTSGRKIERDDKAVYWLATDYYNKAKNVDSSVSGEANRKINAYKPVLPTNEDIHFSAEWTKGESITINSSIGNCYSWINESTTVR